MIKKIDFHRHNLTETDINLAKTVMESIFLTTGPMVAEFERKFADYFKITAAVGLTSCTGALHLALLRAGIGPGDEVITTPMTFVATVAAIMQVGAKPVFVDVCPKSGLLLPDAVEFAITSRTKAILPVHLYGRMVDMIGFSRVAEKHHLAIVEDAAHCIEGVRDGIRPGQLSEAACFSFYATKNITCGEGGALICKSAEDAEWYLSTRHHGISKNASYRYSKKYEHWDMEMMGWKYNMDDIQAALLIYQLDRIEANRTRRQHLETLYRKYLGEINGLSFIEHPLDNEISAHHLFTVLLPENCERDTVLDRLNEVGIGCAVNYRAVHTLKYFKKTFGYKPLDFPIAYNIGNRTITLPLYPRLREEEVVAVCAAMKKILETL